MSHVLDHSMFSLALFPAKLQKEEKAEAAQQPAFILRRSVCYRPSPKTLFDDLPIVFFDFETTGLSPTKDDIIEVGARKYQNGKLVAELEQLATTDVVITDEITQISGIRKDMLEGKPYFKDILKEFFQFIRGSVLIAHNAEFDKGMLRGTCDRLGIDFDWPVICTLKMSRKLLPDLPRHNLDVLAQQFQLSFEARHRAVGDVKVLESVFLEMRRLKSERLRRLSDFAEFFV